MRTMMSRTALLVLLALISGVTLSQEAQIVTVQQTDIKRIAGEVVQVRGSLLTLRHDDGSGREAYRIPRGASISIKGQSIRLQDLQPGQKIRIYYRETSEGRVIVLTPPLSREETPVMIDEEPAEVSTTPDAKPQPETLPAVLPETAGPLPLIGLLGLICLGMGACAGMARRRYR
jgi:hypothetical protein